MNIKYEEKSLRDEIAMVALTGLLANSNADYTTLNEDSPKKFAEDAYLLADAMLEERDAFLQERWEESYQREA